MSSDVPTLGDSRSISLRLIGTPRLFSGGRELALERKAAAALAWLALRGPVLRTRLAEALWPSATPEGARNNLRQLVFKLKRAMDAVVIEGQEELRLSPAVCRDDDGDGELLDGCVYDDCPAFDAWLSSARQAHDEQRAAARLAAIDAALAAGDAPQAVVLARAAVVADEASELAHLRLIQALYVAGDRAAALAAADHGRERLQDSLGIEPSAEWRQLVQTLHTAEVPQARPVVPVAVLRPPRLVGRERERLTLLQARAGERVTLLQAEPGMGKSRLLADCAADLPGALLSGSRPGDAGVPFAALARWLQALAQWRPDVVAAAPAALNRVMPDRGPVPAGVSPLDLQRALVALLRAAREAGLTDLWLDDLHFADGASIEAVQGLIAEPSLQALHWVLARRPAEGSRSLQHLADSLLDEGRLQPLVLEPLNAAQIAELIDSLALPGVAGADLAEPLHRATGGNPLFVLEMIKARLAAPDADAADTRRPRSVRALIERRLRQLSPQALALARVAALAGPDFGTDLAVHVLGTPVMALADAWAELEAAQILRDSAFAHDLVYEATLETVPAPIRRHARRAMAEFLAPRDAEPSRLAEHWLAAGEPARAAPAFQAAGQRAEAAARYAEAQGLFERAAACHEAAGQAQQALDTLLALADLLTEARRFDDSQGVLDALVARVSAVDDRIRVRMAQMNLFLRSDRKGDAITLGEQALSDEILVEDSTPHRLAELRWLLGTAYRDVDRSADALAQFQLSEPELATSEDPSWRCWQHSQHAVALNRLGEVRRAQQLQVHALEAARTVGRKRMIAGVLQNSATIATQAGHLTEALDHLDECQLLMADTGGDDHFSVFVRAQKARLQVWMGRYGEGLDAAEALAAEDSAAEVATRWLMRAALVNLWAWLGQPARAKACLGVVPGDPALVLARGAMVEADRELHWFTAVAPDGDPVPALAGGRDAPVWTLGADPPGAAELLQCARQAPSAVDPRMLAAWRARWDAGGLDGHVLVADVVAAGMAHARGDVAAAGTRAAAALHAMRRVGVPGVYRPALLLEVARAAGRAQPEVSRRALRDGADWIRSVARFQVPESMRDGFLRRNRVNRELLALAATVESGPS